MSHDYHEGAPNYSPAQILKDGCHECKTRSERPDLAINHMDPETFSRAWERADDFRHSRLEDPSLAEIPVLRVLGAVQQQFEQVHVPPAWLREQQAAKEAIA